MTLLIKRDSFALAEEPACWLEPQWAIYRSVWPEAAEWRKTGKLLELARSICCSVVAIHGVEDPHPAAGVEIPLSAVLSDFKMLRINRCGHYPWLEVHGRERFFEWLRSVL
jgi:pimeloyl-ACP methyl ester carboxylesterase